MVEIRKPSIKKIKDVAELLLFLKSHDVNYITPEGRAFLDGLLVSDAIPRVVSKKSYDDLLNEYNHTFKKLVEMKDRYKALKLKRRWI